jgi:hypothetical protein
MHVFFVGKEGHLLHTNPTPSIYEPEVSLYGGLIILVMIREYIVYLACSTKYTTLAPFLRGSHTLFVRLRNWN